MGTTCLICIKRDEINLTYIYTYVIQGMNQMTPRKQNQTHSLTNERYRGKLIRIKQTLYAINP